jgi:subtilisin family serine protease
MGVRKKYIDAAIALTVCLLIGGTTSWRLSRLPKTSDAEPLGVSSPRPSQTPVLSAQNPDQPTPPTATREERRRSFVTPPRMTGIAGTAEQVIELEGLRILTGGGSSFVIDDANRNATTYFLQCVGSIQPAWRSRIEAAGGIIHGYLPHNAFVVDLTPGMAKRLVRESFVHWLQPVEPSHKVQPFLASLIDAGSDELLPVMISTYSSRDTTSVAASLTASGIAVIASEAGKRWGWVQAEATPEQIATIAALDRVQWIEELVAPTLFNDQAVNATHMRATNVWFTHGLTGEGQIIGHADTGLDVGALPGIHPDFAGRIVAAFGLGRGSLWTDPNGHGTHTAGSILGSGTMSTGLFRGVAWEAKLVHQSLLDNSGGLGGLPGDLNVLYLQAYTNGARIHSDSWGASVNGSYTTSSRQSDEFMWDHPDMLLVFAAGNDGFDSDNGIIDNDSIGAPGTAKNVLTVGAAESDRPAGSGGFSSSTYGSLWPFDYPFAPINGDLVSRSADGTNQGMAAFSSRGPTDDGRVKPEVVAPGTDIVSVRSRQPGAGGGWGLNANTNYTFNGGTSMSTPLVAGAAALVREYFVKHRDTAPSAALVKAVLQHGARPMSPGQYGTGAAREIPATVPNNVAGWGHVDLETSLFPANVVWFHLDETSGLTAPGDVREHTFYAETGTVKLTMTYTDFPATAGSGVKLVNDLDLSLRGPGGVEASAGQDRINPSERLLYTVTSAGVYTARVEVFNAPSGPQPYSLVISGPVIDHPIIQHEPLVNTTETSQPYRVAAMVTSAATLAPDAVSLFWKSADDTGDFVRVSMPETTNRMYEGFIPAQSNSTEVLYFIAATSGVFTARDPVGAPESPHRFLVTTPITLNVSGSPAAVFTVSPNYGTHLIASGNVMRLTAPASSNLSVGMRVAVIGWTGTGNVPASGTGNEVSITLDQESSITWLWETQYALTQTSTVAGIVNTTSWWSVWALAATRTAAMEVTHLGTKYGLTGWTIDGQRQPDTGSVAANPANSIAMYGPRTAVAAYMPAALDSNVDGIPDWWTLFHFGTNVAIATADDDSDGFTNTKEYLDRTNPRDAGDVPAPPVIEHTPIADPQTQPSPWNISATITDNHQVLEVSIHGRTNGGGWVVNQLVEDEPGHYVGILDVTTHNGETVVYHIEATDLAGLTTTNGPHTFTIQHAILEASPDDFGEVGLSANTTTSVYLVVSNAGLATLEWTLDRAIYYDNMDYGTGSWTHAGANDVWHQQESRFASTPTAWHFGAGPFGQYPDSANAWLMMEPIHLGAATRLVFDHWASMEYDTDQNDDHYWDGAVVEVSVDGGTNFVMIDPVGGYPHRITDNPASPFAPDTPCYGATDGWEPAEFDLSAFVGETVQIRFRFGSDGFVRDEGWYIDNARIAYLDDSNWVWLSIVTNGLVAPGASTNVPITLDTAQLPMADRCEAILLLDSNDPTRDAPMHIPIVLHNISREITVTHTDNGVVNPSGVLLVDEGSDLTVWMTSDMFYEVGAVITNGEPVANFVRADVTNFTWSSVTDSGTLHIAFMEKMAAGLVPEWWLHQQGLTNDTPPEEAVKDVDGDAMVAWQEFRAVTDPNDEESVALPVVAVISEPGRVLVTWLSFTNDTLRYEVHRTTNLTEGFVVIATNVPATPPVNVFTNPGNGANFETYRVIAH